jgi:two-component sensor histidine kinase
MIRSQEKETNRASCQTLAEALRALVVSDCRGDIVLIVENAARALCNADAIKLHSFCPGHSHTPDLQAGSRPASFATITLIAQGLENRAAMTVYWYGPHAVTSEEHEFLDILAHAASLALRGLFDPARMHVNHSFQPRERERFFEFQRQVRSLLAVIRSIARRMMEHATTVEDYAAHLQGRLEALARIQGFLLRAPDASVDLEELIRAEFLAQSIPDRQLQITGPPILLCAKAVETLGLALHELVTNSIKFGALIQAGGTVDISWRWVEPGRRNVALEWREQARDGVSALGHRGFGFELIEKTLPYELEGTSSIVMRPHGLYCSIRFACAPPDIDPVNRTPPL